MKIAMLARSTLYTVPGGDTIQIQKTAEYLRKNVEVDIFLADQQCAYAKYDLLHFFNIIRPQDILFHVKNSGKPFVISTIFVDYSEYEKKARKGPLFFLAKFFSADTLEYFKNIARWIKNGEKIRSAFYLLRGHRASVKLLCAKASCLLPNSENEYARLKRVYQVSTPYRTIPNAIDTGIFPQNAPVIEKYKNSVVCVARIEGLKNQLNLILACNQLPFQVFIIGDPAPNHILYYEKCKKIAGRNIHFVNHLAQVELASIYASAKVFAMPSWFETTGLSTLEAASIGCNIVISDKGDQAEYFKNFAFYCQPDNIRSIKDAICQAYNAVKSVELQSLVRTQYTWELAAEKTFKVYSWILKKDKK